MDLENEANTTGGNPPPVAKGASGLAIFMSKMMDDPSNYNADGDFLIGRNS